MIKLDVYLKVGNCEFNVYKVGWAVIPHIVGTNLICIILVFKLNNRKMNLMKVYIELFGIDMYVRKH